MLLYVLVYVALCGGCFGYKPTWYPSYGQTYHHPHHSYYHHSQDYDYDEHHRRPQVHQVIPSDVMVDVINDLGLKLLAVSTKLITFYLFKIIIINILFQYVITLFLGNLFAME